MTDRDDAQLRGPVRSVHSEFASIDPQTNDWGPFRQGPTLVYDAEGQFEGRARDDSSPITTTFDARGLRSTVSRMPPRIARQPGMEYGLGMNPQNLPLDFLTRYDAADRPIEVVYRSAQQKTLHRIELAYDANGRLFREKVFTGESIADQLSPGTRAGADAKPPTAQELAQLEAMFRALMPTGVFMTREYEYNTRGLVAELRTTMAGLAESLKTYRYDDRGTVIEEHDEEVQRDLGAGPGGRQVTRSVSTTESWTRHDYRYDDRGNWIERITSQRVPPNPAFRRSGIERRTITYF